MLRTSNFDVMDDIRIFLKNPNPDQMMEDRSFRESSQESASSPLYKSFLMKAPYLQMFQDMVQRFQIPFHGSILELGGGYGYLSCYIKKENLQMEVIYSDVSLEAVRKSEQYERFFEIKLDGKWVTAAEETPFGDECFDIVFFFASFHHVQSPADAVKESYRVLKPGGKLYLLLEPSCPKYLSRVYDLYVKRKGEVRKENHYSLRQYRKFLRKAGFAFRHHNYKAFVHRESARATFYYMVLSLLPNPLINLLLPCSLAVIGEKDQ